MRRIAAILAILLLAVLPPSSALAVVDSTADMEWSSSFGAPVDRSCSSTSGVVYVIFRDIDSSGAPNPPKAKLCGSVTNLHVVPLYKLSDPGSGGTCLQGVEYECVPFAGDTWRTANDTISAIRILKMTTSSSCPGNGARLLRLYKDANYSVFRLQPGAIADYNLHRYTDTADVISSIRVECAIT